jgi:MgtC family protein
MAALDIHCLKPATQQQLVTAGIPMNPAHWLSTETLGQSAIQLGELTLALVLSALIGLEREMRMKSAGLRTHTLVGSGLI